MDLCLVCEDVDSALKLYVTVFQCGFCTSNGKLSQFKSVLFLFPYQIHLKVLPFSEL